jgi:Zn-dependent protease with chaperone function
MTRMPPLGIATALVCLIGGLSLLPGCAVETSSGGASKPSGSPTAGAPAQTSAPLDAGQAERLKRAMVPLIRVMDHPRPLNQVKVAVVDDPHINAANAGGGEFYVTTGLLQKANDQELQAVLAHEVAHEDLGHVAKAQALGAGISIGAVILDQIFPGTGQIAPVAGTLITRSYSRKEEYEADRHGVDLLKRIGQPKEVMIQTLTWLMETEGASGGGFFATHPATGDRIEALRKL